MRLYSHFSVDTLTNTYLIGPENGGDAVLIDPGSFDGALLDLVERSHYYVRNVLLTHGDETHLAGLRTLRRIYDCDIYGAHASILGFEMRQVQHGEVLEICCDPITSIAMPGHSSGSLAYYGSGFLFTGEAMTAAECGSVPNPYAKAILLSDIQERILTLPDETVVLPTNGPPSTIALEKATFPMEDPMRLAMHP